MRIIPTAVFFSFLVALSFFAAVLAVGAINLGSFLVAVPAMLVSAGSFALSIIVLDSDSDLHI
jgi:hypothetical protein